MNNPNPTPSPSQPQRRMWLGAGAAGLLAGAGAFWWQAGSQTTGASEATAGAASSPQQLGDDFWGLKLPQPDGTELHLASLRGRPLLLNFWATWCPPCVREMPMLDAFYLQNKANGLQMLGFAVDNAKSVNTFLQRSPVGFPIVLAGADGSNLARSLGNSGGGLPFTALANAQGRVVRRQMGEVHLEQLSEWVRGLRAATSKFESDANWA